MPEKQTLCEADTAAPRRHKGEGVRGGGWPPPLTNWGRPEQGEALRRGAPSAESAPTLRAGRRRQGGEAPPQPTGGARE